MQNLNSEEQIHSISNRSLANNVNISEENQLGQKQIEVQIKSSLDRHLFIAFGMYN